MNKGKTRGTPDGPGTPATPFWLSLSSYRLVVCHSLLFYRSDKNYLNNSILPKLQSLHAVTMVANAPALTYAIVRCFLVGLPIKPKGIVQNPYHLSSCRSLLSTRTIKQPSKNRWAVRMSNQRHAPIATGIKVCGTAIM